MNVKKDIKYMYQRENTSFNAKEIQWHLTNCIDLTSLILGTYGLLLSKHPLEWQKKHP